MATRHARSVPAQGGAVGIWGEGAEPSEPRADPVQTEGRRARGAATLSCVWWSLHVAGANACEKQIYFCLRFIFFMLHSGRQRISSSMES